MSNLPALPILAPFIAAALILLVKRRPAARRFLFLSGAALHLIVCLVLLAAVMHRDLLVLHAGNWPAPFGIVLAADRLSALMLTITGVLGLATALYAQGEMRPLDAGFCALFHVLLGGLSGAFLTGDLFNLYVWFEVMLMASFGLLIWGQSRAQLDGAIKYVVINLLATLLFLMGLALLYGLTGTLNMAHLYLKLQQHPAPGLVTAVALIFMAAFGIKAAMFPFFFWLPAAYHTPPIAISALMAGMLTKVGVYALLRTFSLVFCHDIALTHGLLLILALATMIVGVLGAAAQYEFRRILSFHIISQVGYMVLGLALWTPLALTGAVFYLAHHMIVKANLFLISGLCRDVTGTLALDRMGGLYRRYPLVAALFFIPAFSLAGFPPLSGFWAKLLIIQASLQTHQYGVAAAAVAVGFLTIYSMVKIWLAAFWKPGPATAAEPQAPVRLSAWKVAPVCALALITVAIGIGVEPVFQLASQAADQLMHPQHYVQAVLGDTVP